MDGQRERLRYRLRPVSRSKPPRLELDHLSHSGTSLPPWLRYVLAVALLAGLCALAGKAGFSGLLSVHGLVSSLLQARSGGFIETRAKSKNSPNDTATHKTST